MEIASFQNVVDDCLLAALEGQLRLTEVVEQEGVGASHAIDLPRAGFVFHGLAGERLETRCHLVGTASHRTRRWVWGWHAPAGLPDPVIEVAGRVRAFGERFGLPELVAPDRPIRVGPQADGTRFGLVASVIGGGLPHHLVALASEQTADGAATLVLLLESERFRPPPASVLRAADVIRRAVRRGTVVDWRRAVASYAGLRGFELDADPAGASVLTASDGSLTITFDARGRVSDLAGDALSA